jgi:hypothetical protein
MGEMFVTQGVRAYTTSQSVQGHDMQHQDNLQSSRYEHKYLIDAMKARDIRDYVRSYLHPDSFTDPESGAGYPVHSLYLDSPDLKLCRQTIRGEKNRFKLRIRFYDDSPNSPAFLEVKRRTYDAIQKRRVAVWRSSLARLLTDHVPDRRYLVKDEQHSYGHLQNFCELSGQIAACPAAYTSYEREAYESREHNSYRVTFDRNIRAGRFTGELSLANREQWPLAPIDGVVLELKFTDRFPNWMHALAQTFRLQRISVPKYVECMNVVESARIGKSRSSPRIVLDCPLRMTTQTGDDVEAIEIEKPKQ